MQINNNNNQLNFRSLAYACENVSKNEIKKVLESRIKPQELDEFIKRLEDSPVTTTLGLADGTGFNRLDAHLHYVSPIQKNPKFREAFSYIAEKKRFNLFNFRPRNFVNKVLSELNTIEETYQIGKYAK